MKRILWCSLGLAAAGVVALVSASSVSSRIRSPVASAPASGARLVAFGTRSPAQWRSPSGRKLDGALADLARHAHLVRPDHVLEDLRLLNPAARFTRAGADAEPKVLIDALTRTDPQALKAALVELGLEHPSVFRNDVSGWLPLRSLDAATARSEVHSLRAAMPRTRAGAVTTQGDFAQGSATIRSDWPTLTGSGVTVGVLSDSFNCYAVYAMAGSGVPASGLNGYAQNGFTATAANDITSGDLPANGTVLEEAGAGTASGTCMDFGPPLLLPYGDEGRAMLQIVHDVAPGASLAFHTAVEGEADFANGIIALASAGAKVIADDVGYSDEPFFQDGIIAQAIDTVEAQGVAYFSAAGNDSDLGYDNVSPQFNTPSTSPVGEMLLNFDTSAATTNTLLPITIAPLVPGEFVSVIVEWDQPYATLDPNNHIANGPGASSALDLCVMGVSGGTDVIFNGTTGVQQTTACTGPNTLGDNSLQLLIIGNPANAGGNTSAESLSLQLGLVSGPAPHRIKVAVLDDGAGSTINSFATQGGTIQGHPGAAGAMAIGAAYFANTPACGTSPAVLEAFSSKGGNPILFDSAGNLLAAPVVRQKPDIIAPDGVANTFLGFLLSGGSGLQCQNNPSFPNFFGTSAATPHVAAVAALMLQSNPAVTPTQIYNALRSSAAPMATPAPDFASGYGFIQASAALALLPPAAPTISVSPTSITLGMSSTLTWSSVNTTGCMASGAWSISPGLSGSQMVTPASTGSLTYTIMCSNAAGSATASTTLSVAAAPPSHGGGGGGLDATALLALAGLTAERALREVRRRRPPL